PAAGIALLQADDVVVAGQLGNLVQRLALAAGRQHVRPAAHGVIAVAAGAGAGLDVGAQQLDRLPLPALAAQQGVARGAGDDALVQRRVHCVASSLPAAARSLATRWSTMRSTSW